MKYIVLVAVIALLLVGCIAAPEADTQELSGECELIATGESILSPAAIDFRLHRCTLSDGTVCVVSSAGGVDCRWAED
jgi:uncharacterized protein YcfL